MHTVVQHSPLKADDQAHQINYAAHTQRYMPQIDDNDYDECNIYHYPFYHHHYDYNPSTNDDGEFVYLKIEIAQTSPKIHFNNNDAKEI